MSFDASLLVMVGIFWAAYWLLRVSFFGPISEILERRKTTTESAQEIYDRVREETESKLETERARLAEARAEAMATREQERREARSRRSERLGEVQVQVQARLSEAAQGIEQQMRRERETLESRSDELAAAIVETLLRRPA